MLAVREHVRLGKESQDSAVFQNGEMERWWKENTRKQIQMLASRNKSSPFYSISPVLP